ncbi:cellulase family glycosylhydrolase [[Mycobacterium] kokjensenii]|uniref:Cellulase family glycosylhydrolase n=1 Tax=[Mycobacterium] kokjensenii TaxID=3064287 RepID=A0ABM9L877_9MYCO|nr:cellulase family glycosylhydrolase [Mycolicibacter sp. MU0083]CAJ1494479.1 cellulase family glycosylhydrolase [Mycolicibacter sp. MU0083]
MARRRSKAVGSRVAGVAAFLAVAPMAAMAPAAHADVDDMMDVLLSPFATADGVLDGAALFDADAWNEFLSTAHWDDSLAALAEPGPAAGLDLYALMHDAGQQWIDSELGSTVNGVINQLFGFGSIVIGNGADGTADNPDGGNGGWLFGDGGNGWNSTDDGVAGGHGGAAVGLFGNGGAGGDGGAGAIGGDGGAGAWLLGDGGNGGDAGDGATDTGLPALGGAGGTAGLWAGSHGASGHFGTLPGGITGTTDPVVQVTDGWLTNADGQVVIWHGLNQVYKVSPYTPSGDGFGEDDAAFLAANGFNSVRLGVIWAGVEPEPGVIDYDYLASIADTVEILARHNIVAILDMHQDLYNEEFGGEGAPDWATFNGGLPHIGLGFPATYPVSPAQNHAWDAFWANEKAPDGMGLQNHYALMWQAVADYFKGNENVAGYDIMNEPWAGTHWLGTILGNPYFDSQQLTPFYNQIDDAIRSVDPNKTVFFEPTALFGSLPVPTYLGTVDDPNSAFSFHHYCMTASLFPGTSFGCDWNADVVFDYAMDYMQEHNVPGWLSEFGATNNLGAIEASLQGSNGNLFGWSEWAYSGRDITSISPEDQALVYDPSKPPVGDNVNWDKLDVLAQPYPQAISGTPTSWSVDNGVFNFSYSTERADGSGSFAAGSETTISVPTSQFPDGYTVTVTGGHVTSEANASQLTIASDSGASTVKVTVTAAS